jgi:hypothetical protein
MDESELKSKQRKLTPKQLKALKLEWRSFGSATLAIEKRLRVSRGEAARRLRHACAEARVRSIKEFREEFEMPPHRSEVIPPSEWRDREVDYDGPDADGSLSYIEISDGDFNYWLAQQPILNIDSHRNKIIRDLLDTGQRPGRNIRWTPFCDIVRCDADGWAGRDKPGHGFSEKQIKRVVMCILRTLDPSH